MVENNNILFEKLDGLVVCFEEVFIFIIDFNVIVD